MIKVGVTGGIGSGKTTFCKKWEEMGAFILYADDFAKELMVSNKELISSIKKVFGSKAYFESGDLNREFLAKEAFGKGRIAELNSIVHPLLWEQIEAISEQKEKEGIKVFVKEAAILLQNGRPNNLDYIVLLISDEEERIKRAVDRDGLSSTKILERIKKQPDFYSKLSLADFIVENNGSLNELHIKAEEIYNLIK